MADDKIKIYGELESGVPGGKVVDASQVRNLNIRNITVTSYPFPSTRNIEIQPETFTAIWQNITIPARSEVYARVTLNLQQSSTVGHLVCCGFLAGGLTVASTAAPLPAVAAVEHSMCLSHWFEEETTLSVMVHSTVLAYATDIVNPVGAKMPGGTELIVKTYA